MKYRTPLLPRTKIHSSNGNIKSNKHTLGSKLFTYPSRSALGYSQMENNSHRSGKGKVRNSARRTGPNTSKSSQWVLLIGSTNTKNVYATKNSWNKDLPLAFVKNISRNTRHPNPNVLAIPSKNLSLVRRNVKDELNHTYVFSNGKKKYVISSWYESIPFLHDVVVHAMYSGQQREGLLPL
jgi:hypothetical protein